jgi:hypothetical protein
MGNDRQSIRSHLAKEMRSREPRVSITSSSPMSITCAVCCRHTLSITMEAARISRSARIAPSVAQPELLKVTEPVLPTVVPAAIASLGGRRAQNTCGESASQESGAPFDHRTSATTIFIGTPIPWPDGLLSKDKYSSEHRSHGRMDV